LHPAPEVDTAIEMSNEKNVDKFKLPDTFDPYSVQPRIWQTSGWFNVETGELYKGFRVAAEDVVLDVGCGGGSNALFCANQGAHITFADIDKDMVLHTSRLVQGTSARKVDAIVTDANPLPRPDGMFTRIVSTEVIEHVADPRAFLSELVRVGKSGALYLLAVPDPASENIYKKIAHPSCFEHPNHIRILDRSEFEKLVSEAGLEIVAHDFYGAFFTIWWSLFWCDRKDGLQPRHPALDAWSATWDALLDTEHGARISDVLDKAIPKSQIIIARKP
jgi:2-polyprenyl-3-methyl-5-hydroxy-6-metoxy-1,4-benzoquinol methylase